MRTSTLSRQRLLDRLASATQNRVTLVIADSGYGKTTLLADFSRRFDGAALWYSLESTDTDWMTMVHHLVAAGREVAEEFGGATLSLLRNEPGMSPPKAAVLSSFVQELQAFANERTMLVLDDVHLADDSEDTRLLLLRLIREAPRSLSFVLISRRRPALTLARWAGMGEMAELTTDDLRFSYDETARLFNDSYGQALEHVVLNELEARIRGWVACLQLFNTLISGYPPSAIKEAATSLSGASDPLYDYLAQEVVAHLSNEMQAFVTRASLLQSVLPEYLQAVFPEVQPELVERWSAEADALGLLNRISQFGSSRQFHPLLRDFLLGEIGRRHTADQIAQFHVAIAQAAESDPLTACHHYIEAGLFRDAMRCLGSSTLETMGSARWGTAAQLAARLGNQTPTGAVAAIQGRRLLEEGSLETASAILSSIDIAAEEPTVRAVLRHTLLVLAWRQGDAVSLMRTLDEILTDAETPELMREIAQVFSDSSPRASSPVTLTELATRLKRMGERQAALGHNYYAAISFHNAAICASFAARHEDSIDLCAKALARFESLSGRPPEFYSTHAVLATIYLEIGDRTLADKHRAASQSSGIEHADVHSGHAYDLAVTGDVETSMRHLVKVDDLTGDGRSDIVSYTLAAFARSFVLLSTDALEAFEELDHLPPGDFPLDFGYSAQRYVLMALCMLLAGDTSSAISIAQEAKKHELARGNRMAVVRLDLLASMAQNDTRSMRKAISAAASSSQLALLEVADAIGQKLDTLVPIPLEIDQSIERWPERWQPVLRRQLERGDDPRAFVAARLLDEYGAFEDVGRLRAFDKTYRRRGSVAGLGKKLARRVSPRLNIHDLGQVALVVGNRVIRLSETRRKPAGLLMYLVTRPNFTATRDQVIENLWPEGDSVAGLNSLNQSLYFMRREIDPWYEDDISPEYLCNQAELVTLDPAMVRVDSAEFLANSRRLLSGGHTVEQYVALLDLYHGQFSPEFEYEEWAIAWRATIHGAYLDFARSAILIAAKRGQLRTGCDIALKVLSVDPSAEDIERMLVWLYWHSGAISAAESQYTHISARARADGLDALPISEIVAPREPP